MNRTANANWRVSAVSTLLVTPFCVVACTPGYDFRSDDRPAYDHRVSTAELAGLQAKGARILDVRLIEDFEADPVLIPDAIYRNPDEIERWTTQMSPADGPVVVYCVRGTWVSQKAANYLAEKGFEVYSLDGGIEGWKAAEGGSPIE